MVYTLYFNEVSVSHSFDFGEKKRLFNAVRNPHLFRKNDNKLYFIYLFILYKIIQRY